MVNNPYVVVWPPDAWKHLQKVYLFIKKDSFQNAENVRDAILQATNQLAVNPQINPADKYKTNNDDLLEPLNYLDIVFLIKSQRMKL